MKRIIRLTESDLNRIVKRVLNEQVVKKYNPAKKLNRITPNKDLYMLSGYLDSNNIVHIKIADCGWEYTKSCVGMPSTNFEWKYVGMESKTCKGLYPDYEKDITLSYESEEFLKKEFCNSKTQKKKRYRM